MRPQVTLCGWAGVLWRPEYTISLGCVLWASAKATEWLDALWVGRLQGGSKLGLFEASDITAPLQPTHPKDLANGGLLEMQVLIRGGAEISVQAADLCKCAVPASKPQARTQWIWL